MENLKSKTEKELIKELSKARKDLHDFRFDISGSKIRNTKQAKNIKKQIARILTSLNSK